MTKKILMAMVVVLISGTIYLFPIMWANETDCAFRPNDCDGGFVATSTRSLRYLIIEGAEQFYSASSLFMAGLKEYEGGNYIEAKTNFSKSAISMRSANAIYKVLYLESFYYEYDPKVITALKLFNYDKYHVAYKLLPTVFQKVKEFLIKGDIRGAYKELEVLTGNIASDIESIEPFEIPSKEIIWRINQDIAVSILFGQYISEIFNQII
jgi:hypothetical protein